MHINRTPSRSAPARVAAAILAAVLAVPASWGAPPGDEGKFVVIVNAGNPLAELHEAALARLFLKKVRKWDDGRSALPVDQSMTSPIRARFARDVLKLSIGELREYWMRETFSGREVPPVVKASEAEVLELVGSEPGAVAYVSANAALPAAVKVVSVKE